MSADTHPLLVEAHAGLDLTGSVLAQGATVAPDFTMRSILAMRERLDRHHPHEDYPHMCWGCNQYWPCPDVLGDFKVLGIDPDEELPADA